TGGGREVALTLNARTYQVNGQTRTMSAKPMLVNGRCYVPLDVVQAVLPGTFRYEPKTRTVRFDPPAPKSAHK
ncbi:MAG: copper amine oxidase N-terminal domain-containing protein, partial [Armatimonadota bacterium]|nr:copper amine oxidase N-terminal domain-containing protein [Armatimonadota bacterium]